AGFADDLGDFAHDLAHQLLVFAFAHDADHRFGARFAHQEPSAAVQPLFAGAYVRGHLGVAERLAPAQPHILEKLRRRLENVSGLARRPVLFGKHRKHLERRDQAVARGDEIAEDDVAGLLAADIETAFAHFFDDVAVADGSAHQLEVLFREIAFQPDVRHHGADDAAALQLAAPNPGARDQSQHLIAVDDRAFLVAHHHPVRIAVEGDAKISARLLDLLDHGPRRGRADILVDVQSVGID